LHVPWIAVRILIFLIFKKLQMRIVLNKFLDFQIILIVIKNQINFKFLIAAVVGVYLNFQIFYFKSTEQFRFLCRVGISIMNFGKIMDFQFFIIQMGVPF